MGVPEIEQVARLVLQWFYLLNHLTGPEFSLLSFLLFLNLFLWVYMGV